MSDKNQRKSGVIIHYFNMVMDMAIAIFFTPFLISSLGDAEYGLYRIVQSFAGQLGVMSFGVATLVARNIVKYNTLGDQKKKENFLAMAMIVTGILSVLVLAVGGVLSFGIDGLFDSTFTKAEISLAHKLYWILIARIVVTIITDFVNGILSAHEKFGIIRGLTTFRYIFRVLILIVLIKLDFGSMAIVLTDLSLGVAVLAVTGIYAFATLKEKIHYYYLDKEELKVSAVFSFAIFLQAVINQVNQNLDSVILGALTTTAIVTMYSLALTLFNSFNSLSSVIGSVFVPKATKMYVEKADWEEMTDLVIKPGRLQFMAGSLIISGFALFGREFFHYWVGDKYGGAYAVSLILMIPALIPVVQNVTNAILDAMLKRLGRSVILTVMAAINVGVSVVLVKYIGYIGAAIGTAFSFTVGNGIFMNIYLHRVTGLNLKRMYKEILSSIVFVALGLTAVFYYPATHFFVNRGIVLFGVKIISYVIIYAAAMYFVCMRKNEKDLLLSPVKKIIGRRSADK